MDDAERMQGEELLRKTSWVVTELPDLGVPKVFDHMFLKDPTLRTKHYVVGERSPFIYKGPSVITPSSSTATTPTTTTAADSSGRMIGTVCTYAIYAGHYSINGSYMLQGGAISSIFIGAKRRRNRNTRNNNDGQWNHNSKLRSRLGIKQHQRRRTQCGA